MDITVRTKIIKSELRVKEREGGQESCRVNEWLDSWSLEKKTKGRMREEVIFGLNILLKDSSGLDLELKLQ